MFAGGVSLEEAVRLWWLQVREGAEIFAYIGECVVIRVESAVDGIDKAVVRFSFMQVLERSVSRG